MESDQPASPNGQRRPLTPHPARVVVADDHPAMRAGLCTVLENDPDITVVGTASSIISAARAVGQLQPDVLMLDQRLPDGEGIGACPSLLRIDRRLRIVIVTQFDSADLVRSAFAVGARGYIVKGSDPCVLRDAVHTVMAGHRYTDASAVAADYGLTAREVRVLGLLAQGLTNVRIGGHLGISAHSVRTHVSRIMAKLGAANRAEAAALAVEVGLVRLRK